MAHKISRKENTNPNSSNDDLLPTVIDEEPELLTNIEMSKFNLNVLVNKFKQGTMFHSIWSLYSFSPLISWFYAPKIFMWTGIIPTIIIIIIIALCSYITSCMLLKILIEHNVMNIYSLIYKVISHKVMYIFSFVNLIYWIGFSLIHISVCNALIKHIWNYFSPDQEITWIVIISMIIWVQIPLTFAKKDIIVNIIHIINGIGIIIIGIVQVVFMFLNMDYHQKYKDTWFGSISFNACFSIGVIWCTFWNQNNLWNQTQEMANFSIKRGHKLVIYTNLLQFLSWIIFGLSGLFVLNGQASNVNDISFYLWSDYDKINKSTWLLIAKIFLLFILENNISYLWIQIADGVSPTFNKELSVELFSILIILGLVLSNLVVFLLNNHIRHEIVFCILGGICTWFWGYHIPIWGYRKVFGKGSNWTELNSKNLILSLMLFVLITIVGVFTSVLGVINYTLFQNNK